jgi:aspartyl-tRNA(Asn)/glutamyl-tRNA(Gln) amidotransferase subunit C
MALTLDEIKHIADLSRLELSEVELEKYSRELPAILDYVGQLQEVDVSAVEASTQLSGVVCVGREDEARPWDEDEVELALKQASETENNQIKVHRVLE